MQIDHGRARARRAGCESLYASVRQTLEGALFDMAAKKNVTVAPELGAKLADAIMDKLALATISGIAGLRREALGTAGSTINRLLDICAATRVLDLLWAVDGIEHPGIEHIRAQAQAWTSDCPRNDNADWRYRWPDEEEMVREYLKARSSGPVSIMCPAEKPGQMGYLLDRAAHGAAANKAAGDDAAPPQDDMPVPLLIRCPGLPAPHPSMIRLPGDQRAEPANRHVDETEPRDG